MEKRSFGKLRLTRETLRNLTSEEMSKVVGGRTENCTTDTSQAFSVCWKCQPTGSCPGECGTLSCDGCNTGATQCEGGCEPSFNPPTCQATC